MSTSDEGLPEVTAQPEEFTLVNGRVTDMVLSTSHGT